jgi:tungstate transport system substrate-binding protein
MEIELWQAAGVDPRAVKRREETGQGMGATLNVADQRRGYTLTDRGTYLALKRRLKLDVIRQGDRRLLNIYHAYVVSPAKHPKVKQPQANAFVEFLVSPEAQRRIAALGVSDFGEPLFFADAHKTEAELGAAAPPPAPSATGTPRREAAPGP